MKLSCSAPITLLEISGLNRDLDAKLTGPRARFWLKALKRLARKENPWIRFEKVLEVSDEGSSGTPLENLQKLDDLGIHVFDGLLDFVREAEGTNLLLEPSEDSQSLPSHDIVAVRLGDLLTLGERTTFTYAQLLEKAQEEYGFDKCDLNSGLLALTKIVGEQKKLSRDGHSRTNIICTSPFRLEGEKCDRVPMISDRAGDHAPNKQGLATLYSIDVKLHSPNPAFNESINSIQDPEVRLLFRSIPW